MRTILEPDLIDQPTEWRRLMVTASAALGHACRTLPGERAGETVQERHLSANEWVVPPRRLEGETGDYRSRARQSGAVYPLPAASRPHTRSGPHRSEGRRAPDAESEPHQAFSGFPGRFDAKRGNST